MTRATDFEFRNRWWFFGAIFGASFTLFAIDHVPAGARLADALAARVAWAPATAERLVLGAAAAVMVAAALVRTWGSAYLGRDVVHGAAVRSETLHADGPYRHVRNPLYLGNVLMAVGMAAIALNILWLYAGFVASPLLSWLAGAALGRRGGARAG